MLQPCESSSLPLSLCASTVSPNNPQRARLFVRLQVEPAQKLCCLLCDQHSHQSQPWKAKIRQDAVSWAHPDVIGSKSSDSHTCGATGQSADLLILAGTRNSRQPDSAPTLPGDGNVNLSRTSPVVLQGCNITQPQQSASTPQTRQQHAAGTAIGTARNDHPLRATIEIRP